MYLVVDANWAKQHPELAAKIQVAHLLKRLRAKNGANPKRVTASEWKSKVYRKKRVSAH